MIQQGHRVLGSNVVVLGITFKENCPEIRNSCAINVVRELELFGCKVEVFAPWAEPEEVKEKYGIDLVPKRRERGRIGATLSSLEVSSATLKASSYEVNPLGVFEP